MSRTSSSKRLLRRRFGPGAGLLAMSIYTAKNRDFDGVVVLWPYQAAGSTDRKRHLLYNAITRARRWCLALVQSDALRGVRLSHKRLATRRRPGVAGFNLFHDGVARRPRVAHALAAVAGYDGGMAGRTISRPEPDETLQPGTTLDL